MHPASPMPLPLHLFDDRVSERPPPRSTVQRRIDAAHGAPGEGPLPLHRDLGEIIADERGAAKASQARPATVSDNVPAAPPVAQVFAVSGRTLWYAQYRCAEWLTDEKGKVLARGRRKVTGLPELAGLPNREVPYVAPVGPARRFLVRLGESDEKRAGDGDPKLLAPWRAAACCIVIRLAYGSGDQSSREFDPTGRTPSARHRSAASCADGDRAA